MRKYWITFLASLTLASSTLVFYQSKKESDRQIVALDSLIAGTETPQIAKNGKAKKSQKLKKIYTKVAIDSLTLPSISDKFRQALEHQFTLLKRADDREIGELEIEVEDLEKVIDIFRKARSTKELSDWLDAYQIKGEDGEGSVQFTGYYSPIIPARRKADPVFKHPVLIAKSEKDDDNLTYAYVRDRQDIKSMRVEGIAYLQFPDGEKRVVAYSDTRKLEVESEDHDLKSTEDHDLRNTEGELKGKKMLTSYTSVFTAKDKNKAVGAAKIPLTTDYTVAVDADYIPLGSVLLAEVPILDAEGKLIRTEFRFVLAQDTGSKIQGTGHVDLYMGEGDMAKERIRHMSKYGRIWLLLPKKETKLLAQNF
jgi:membrane-bound lytic murein transglycosylase A